MAKIHFMREEFEKSREIVIKQLKLKPEDVTLKYDLAVILLESATQALNKDYRTVKECEQAILDLTFAHSLFEQLAKIGQANAHLYYEKQNLLKCSFRA
jgi:hypothetical protein